MRWRVLALLFIARAGAGVQFQALGAVSDDVATVFGLDWSTIGLLIGLFMVPGLLLALAAGYAGRYAKDITMVQIGIAALALGGLVAGVANAPWMIGLGRVLAGTGFLLLNVYPTKMIVDWFDGQEIATALSIFVMSWPLGIAIGQVGHVWLAETFGWQLPFLAASAYAIAASVGLRAFYTAPQLAPQAASGPATKLLASEWRAIALIAAIWGLFNAAYIIYLSFGPALLETLGRAPLAAAGIISATSWLMIVAGAICGRIVDRFGRPEVVLVLCMIGGIAALLLLQRPGAGLAGSVLFGVIGMAPAGIIVALAGQALRPEVRAFGMGVFFTIYYAILLVAPPIAGALRDADGTPESPLALSIAALAAIIPLAIAFALAKRRPAVLSTV